MLPDHHPILSKKENIKRCSYKHKVEFKKMKWKKMRVIWSFSVVDRRAKDIFSLFLVLPEPKKYPKRSLAWAEIFLNLSLSTVVPFFLVLVLGLVWWKRIAQTFNQTTLLQLKKIDCAKPIRQRNSLSLSNTEEPMMFFFYAVWVFRLCLAGFVIVHDFFFPFPPFLLFTFSF